MSRRMLPSLEEYDVAVPWGDLHTPQGSLGWSSYTPRIHGV